jgi:hypothetical protein
VLIVLIAPEDYGNGSTDTQGFYKRISYDAIREWFSSADQMGNRRHYKLSLLKSAIDRGETGWTLIPNNNVTLFWQNYWLVAEKNAKELRMPKPADKPATSSFIYFQPTGLGKNVILIHKVQFGKVDLQFAGMGEQLDAIEKSYNGEIDNDMIITKASKSGVIRIKVPELNLQEPLSEIEVKVCLDAALRLLRVYKKHKKAERAT